MGLGMLVNLIRVFFFMVSGLATVAMGLVTEAKQGHFHHKLDSSGRQGNGERHNIHDYVSLQVLVGDVNDSLVGRCIR